MSKPDDVPETLPTRLRRLFEAAKPHMGPPAVYLAGADYSWKVMTHNQPVGEYIVAAVNALPELLDEIERLAATRIESDGQKALARANETLADFHRDVEHDIEEHLALCYAYRDSVRAGGIALCLNGMLAMIARARKAERRATAAETRLERVRKALKDADRHYRTKDICEALYGEATASGPSDPPATE